MSRNLVSSRPKKLTGVSGVSMTAIALAILGTIPQAIAQGTSGNTAQRPNQLEDIVVTAQKREENLQAVPVAVTAVTRSQIENLQVQNFSNLSGLAPNLTVTENATGSSPLISLRGILGNNFGTGQDSGVALYLDGVYLSRSSGAGADVADIDRIEVLRGPQGTLYGRNSTGGAINYISSAPKGEFYARQEVTVGNLSKLRTKTRLDLPTFGAFSVSLAYLHDERDGWIRNSQAGLVWDFSQATSGKIGRRKSVSTLGGRNTDAGRIAVRYAPESIPLTVDYKYDLSYSHYTQFGKQQIVVGSKPLDEVPMGFTTPEKLKVFGHNLTIQYDISDDLQFKSVTGYRGFEDSLSNDVIGGNDFPLFQNVSSLFYERHRSFSQEVQLSYRSELFDVIGGLYYFREKIHDVAPLYTFQLFPGFVLPSPDAPLDAGGSISYGNSRSRNKSIAAFGQATVHITPQLDITGGIRGTKDTRFTSSTGLNQAPFGCGPTSLAGPCVIIPIPGFPRTTFKKVDWTANITYRPTDDLMVYAKAGTGYLSGGIYNGRAFEPEKLLQYEVGVKSDLLDKRLRINAAAFRSRYDNLQQATNNPAPPNLYQVFNVGKARITGFEIEATALPIDNLTFTANYGYTKYQFRSFIFPGIGDITDIARDQYLRPKHNLNLIADLRFGELGSGIQPSINVNARWHSNTKFNLFPMTDPALEEFMTDNAVWDVDARATLAEIPLGGLKGRASAWVRNLLDKRTLVVTTALSPSGPTSGQFHEPRTYGLDVSVEF